MTGTLASLIPHLASIPSPPQGVWKLGPLPLRAYALCIIAGIIVATLWGNRRFVARGGRPGRITDLAVWMVPFGLVGGRLYHVITDNELYFRPGRNPWNAFAIWDGGLGIWGAVALGGVGAWLGCRHYKIRFGAVADALAPAIVLAQAMGRVGNYFNQELFGSHTTLPWGLDVYLRTPGGVAGTRAMCGTGEFPTEYIKATPTVLCGTYHPTFLYELIWDVGVALLVVWADRRFRLGGGRAFWLYVAGYTLGRGWIEMLRIDTANHFLGLRINVFTAIIMFLVAVGFLIALRHRTREDPALLWGIGPGDPPGPRGNTEPEDDSGGDGGGDGDVGLAAEGDGPGGAVADVTELGGAESDGAESDGAHCDADPGAAAPDDAESDAESGVAPAAGVEPAGVEPAGVEPELDSQDLPPPGRHSAP